MTREQLKRRFPNASSAFLEANAGLPDPEPKRDRRKALGKGAPDEEGRTLRPLFCVTIVSYRTRLLDEDNLKGGAKFLTDAMRYEKLIPGDSPKDIILDVSQVKVSTEAEEGTVVCIAPTGFGNPRARA